MASVAVKELPKDELAQIVQKYLGYGSMRDHVLIGEEETLMPRRFVDYAKSIQEFNVRDDDVWVCTYPKVGTTWTQELVWLLVNDFDFQAAKRFIFERTPFVEITALKDMEIKMENDDKVPPCLNASIEFARTLKSPRVLKTHLPFSLLPNQLQNGSTKAKMIYVVRDPKDACVSYYHHGLLLKGWCGSIDDFVTLYLGGRVLYGCFWKHTFGYWNRRRSQNMLVISYEEMKKNLAGVAERVGKFLGKEISREQMQKLLEHLSLESMRNNPAVNLEGLIKERRMKGEIKEEQRFIRSGTVGKYKEELSEETIEKLRRWIRDNADGTDFGREFSHYLC